MSHLQEVLCVLYFVVCRELALENWLPLINVAHLFLFSSLVHLSAINSSGLPVFDPGSSTHHIASGRSESAFLWRVWLFASFFCSNLSYVIRFYLTANWPASRPAQLSHWQLYHSILELSLCPNLYLPVLVIVIQWYGSPREQPNSCEEDYNPFKLWVATTPFNADYLL